MIHAHEKGGINGTERVNQGLEVSLSCEPETREHLRDWGVTALRGLKGHLGPQNIQLHQWRGETITEGTDTSAPLPQGGLAFPWHSRTA